MVFMRASLRQLPLLTESSSSETGSFYLSNNSLFSLPEEKSAVVAQVKKQIALEFLESTDTGWVKVRHLDGMTGYVKAAQVWGN